MKIQAKIEMVSFEPRLNCHCLMDVGGLKSADLCLLSITKIMDRVWSATISIRGIVYEETVWILSSIYESTSYVPTILPLSALTIFTLFAALPFPGASLFLSFANED